MEILFYPCGTEVILKGTALTGIITGCLWEWQNISYKVSYFSNGTHATIWISDNEFDLKYPSMVNKNPIGFIKPKI